MKTRSLINNNGNAVKNAVIVELADQSEILTFYNTPIAAFISGRGYIRTEQFHSVTTSKHINQYVGGKGMGESVTQQELDALYKAI